MVLNLTNFSISGLSTLTLVVNDAECIGVSGDSGSGKTRLLRAIADLDEHDGDLALDDVSYLAVPANQWRHQVALLPAESLWWFDSIGEHFSGKNTVLNQLGFTDEAASWDSARCSSGEKQRLSVLRLLANKPRVLLLDEPTSNLDKENSSLVEQLIANYIVENNAIAIWVSHDQQQLDRVSSRQYKIQKGQLIINELAECNND